MDLHGAGLIVEPFLPPCTSKDVNPSLLRESFAVRYLRAGGDLCTQWELLGQKKSASFKHSLRMSDEGMDNQRAGERLEGHGR